MKIQFCVNSKITYFARQKTDVFLFVRKCSRRGIAATKNVAGSANEISEGRFPFSERKPTFTV
jgi:hypothetical protein